MNKNTSLLFERQSCLVFFYYEFVEIKMSVFHFGSIIFMNRYCPKLQSNTVPNTELCSVVLEKSLLKSKPATIILNVWQNRAVKYCKLWGSSSLRLLLRLAVLLLYQSIDKALKTLTWHKAEFKNVKLEYWPMYSKTFLCSGWTGPPRSEIKVQFWFNIFLVSYIVYTNENQICLLTQRTLRYIIFK